MHSVGEKNYTLAVKQGSYDLYVGNLFGKYDNVRIHWEDQLTRITLRPFLQELVEQRQQEKKGLRIVDLGCGSGQGYEILTKIDRRNLDLGLQHKRILHEEDIELYLGLDISDAMVEKGQTIFSHKPQVSFAQADLREGLGAFKREAPFDIYFSSYGSLSHLSRDTLTTLMHDICEHGHNDSLVVLDFVGRYSIEWPDFWGASLEAEKVRDYSMSYLYSEPARQQLEMEKFPLRFWTGQEVRELAQEVSQATGIQVTVMSLLDRSIMVGRHTDTREYNPKLKTIRRFVNSLHEDYLRTDLQGMRIDPAIVPDHPEVAMPLRSLIDSWNTVIDFCQRRLVERFPLVELEGWAAFAPPLHFALMTIDRVIADVGWMWYGDPRANIIEPQLGYALRTLEYEMQQGLGCGHGLLVVLKLQK